MQAGTRRPWDSAGKSFPTPAEARAGETGCCQPRLRAVSRKAGESPAKLQPVAVSNPPGPPAWHSQNRQRGGKAE